MQTRRAADIIVDQLRANGVKRVFCVPGESYLDLLDALVDSGIDVITCRNEGGAAFMAEATGKLTGTPGVCLVTRGPGATNASIGLHCGLQDSTPMVVFVGQVGRDMLGREAFQEVDFRKFYSEVSKHVEEVPAPERMDEVVGRAFSIAQAGRPGPTVVVLPEDLLREVGPVSPRRAAPVPAQPAISPAQMAEVTRMIGAAERPLMILGGPGWTPRAVAQLQRFAEAHALPVASGLRCQDRFDNRHPLYMGELGTGSMTYLRDMVKAADLLVVLGERLGEMTTAGYSLIDVPQPQQKLVHILPEPAELGKVYTPDLAIASAVAPFAALAAEGAGDPAPLTGWARTGRKGFEAAFQVAKLPGEIDFAEVMRVMNDRLGPDAIITHGAGNYTGWPQRHYMYRAYPSQLAPICGAMGYGVPAAIAAKAEKPDCDVVAFAGDGCFMMNGQELATAAQYGIAPVVLVLDNAMLGTIRMHQQGRYPGRISGTALKNPDFAALARAYGGVGFTVRTTAEFAPAFEEALTAGVPAVIHMIVDPDIRTVRSTFSGGAIPVEPVA